MLHFWSLLFGVVELFSKLHVFFCRIWIGVNDRKQDNKYET